jgi:hypothetical protein
LFNAIPYYNKERVGVHPFHPQFVRVLEVLQKCRFSLKKIDNLNHSTTSPPDIIFRNLFFPCPEEIIEFERLLTDDIYSLLMKAIGTDMSRDKFKEEFFHFLYRPAFNRYDKVRHADGTVERTEEPVRKAFGTLLPSILLFLDICKCRPGTLNPTGRYYKWISRAILTIESQIMLECCANLWRKYPNMFLTTVHDCIKCLPQDVEKVKAELTQTFEKYHVSPKFEVKYHKAPN